MKFSTSIVLAFVAGAFAESASTTERQVSAVERDIPTITNAISKVLDSTKSLDNQIKSYNGGNVDSIVNANKDLLGSLQSATQQISGTEPISTNDALGLQAVGNDLNSTVTSTIIDLVAKKDPITKAGAAKQVADALGQLKTDGQSLADATTKKLPENIQPIAGRLISQFVNGISDAQKQFNDAKKRSMDGMDGMDGMSGMDMGKGNDNKKSDATQLTVSGAALVVAVVGLVM